MHDEISLQHMEDIENGAVKRLVSVQPLNAAQFTLTFYNQSAREIAEYIREFHPGARYEEI